MVLLSIAVPWRYAVVARVMGDRAPVHSSCAVLCVGHLAMVMAVVASIAMVLAMAMITVLVLAMAWCRLWSWCCCVLCCRYCVLCCALMRVAGDDAVLQRHRQCAGAPSDAHTDS